MNKKNNRKGFTIVELVIVIAVSAILATVLGPTFGNVIDKAQASAALQEAKSIHTNYVASINYADGLKAAEDFWIVINEDKTADTYYVQVSGGKVTSLATTTEPPKSYFRLTISTTSGVTTYTVTEVTA